MSSKNTINKVKITPNITSKILEKCRTYAKPNRVQGRICSPECINIKLVIRGHDYEQVSKKKQDDAIYLPNPVFFPLPHITCNMIVISFLSIRISQS